MKRLTLTLFAAASLAACGGDDSGNKTNGNDLSASSDMKSAADLRAAEDLGIAKLTDAQSAQIVLGINTGEVQVAQSVQSRLTVPGITSFASMMISMHTQAKTDAQALFTQNNITPAPSATSMALDAATAQVQSSLATATPVDQPYIDSQVAMHAQALLITDCVLIPAVQNASFQSLLTTMRATVAMHLDEAKQLGGMAAASGPDGGTSSCADLCTDAGGLPAAVRATLCSP